MKTTRKTSKKELTAIIGTVAVVAVVLFGAIFAIIKAKPAADAEAVDSALNGGGVNYTDTIDFPLIEGDIFAEDETEGDDNIIIGEGVDVLTVYDNDGGLLFIIIGEGVDVLTDDMIDSIEAIIVNAEADIEDDNTTSVDDINDIIQSLETLSGAGFNLEFTEEQKAEILREINAAQGTENEPVKLDELPSIILDQSQVDALNLTGTNLEDAVDTDIF